MVVAFNVSGLGRFDQDVVEGVEVGDGRIVERFHSEKAEDHHYEGVTAEKIRRLFNSTIYSPDTFLRVYISVQVVGKDRADSHIVRQESRLQPSCNGIDHHTQRQQEGRCDDMHARHAVITPAAPRIMAVTESRLVTKHRKI